MSSVIVGPARACRAGVILGVALGGLMLGDGPMTAQRPDTVSAVVNVSGRTLDQLREAWIDGYQRGDVDALADLYTADAVRMPYDAQTQTGREAVLQAYATSFATRTLVPRIAMRAHGQEGTGGWMSERGSYREVLRTPDGSLTLLEVGKYVSLARRGADGRWRYQWSIFNRDGPARRVEPGDIVESAGTGPGAALEEGMTLHYRAASGDPPPWTIDSVRPVPAPLAGAACIRVFLRRGTQAEDRRNCAARDTLFLWSQAVPGWVAERPLAPGMRIERRRATGEVVTFTAGRRAVDTIGGRPVEVLETTVVTRDSLGRPVRRLRERYAPALITATSGIFETGDPSAPDGWRVTERFELVAIRP